MKCVICESLTFNYICDTCQKSFIKKSISLRRIGNLTIYSMYNFDEYRYLIDSKYYHSGFEILQIFAKNIRGEIDKLLSEETYIIPIDDRAMSDYSHTAVIAKTISTNLIKPIYGLLTTDSHVKYAGKSLEFRQKNKKGFSLHEKHRGVSDFNNVVLLDDIVTTGTTLLEAKDVLEEENIKVQFAITLFDAAR